MNRHLTKGDIDGFFALFMDNLLQLMLIKILCSKIGLPDEIVNERMLPGAAVSILGGNLFYSWQAFKLSKQTGRKVTALPYGINTVSLIAFIFMVIGPVYWKTQDADLAWKVGLFACFASGVMEMCGAFVGDWLRRHTPRAALLAALAGIAITFISMDFVFQMFASPLIAILPMFLLLTAYASKTAMPLRIPGGLFAVICGTALAWIAHATGLGTFAKPMEEISVSFYAPQPVNLFEFLTKEEGWKYLSVIIPMGLFNILGSLQNLESAAVSGDRFQTRSSMLVNGLGSILAAFFGSAFPTTIYIGHPAWKSMGAGHGYSVLNAIVITPLCLLGGVTLFLHFIPQEAMLGILLWIGLMIASQAYEAVPNRHALAVAFGLIPCLASWVRVMMERGIRASGESLFSVKDALMNEGAYLDEGCFHHWKQPSPFSTHRR